MALKNLFDMVIADKYTADGREAIIKAQEAETEDKVYQIGEISQKTGLQKTANGWVKPKKGAAGKTSRASKEEAIRKDLGLTAGEDMSRFSDQQIETMYAKTQQTPEQQKADFDKSKIGQAVNKGRQEFAAEKTRQKELASKTNAIGLPKESKPALSQTDGKGNKVEIKITESKGGGFYVDKYVNGKKVGINNANTRESAEAKAKSMMEQHMADPDYKAEEKPGRDRPALKKEDHVKLAKEVLSNTSATDPGWTAEEIAKEWKLGKADAEEVKKEFDNLRKGSSGNKPAAQKRSQSVKSVKEYLTNNFWSQPEDFKNEMSDAGWDVDEMTNEYAVISNEAGSQYEVRFADHGDGRDLTMKSFKALQIDEDDDDSLEDSAPRVLTGDTRIRVRKA